MPSHCVICGTSLSPSTLDWLKHCEKCALAVSALDEPSYNPGPLLGWDAESERFMRALRVKNAEFLLARLARHRPLAGCSLLDVGCAAGWFLQCAEANGISGTGIEPDVRVAESAARKGLDVVVGYFPECLPADRRFDIICMHDVFEHLADPRAVLEAIHGALAPDGLVLLNLPDAQGVLYRLAHLAGRLGDARLLDRLWQKGYESPHLFYYNRSNLVALLASAGFDRIAGGRLPSVALNGLWARINEGRTFHPLISTTIFAGVVVSYPLLRYVLPSDIMYQIFRPSTPRS